MEGNIIKLNIMNGYANVEGVLYRGDKGQNLIISGLGVNENINVTYTAYGNAIEVIGELLEDKTIEAEIPDELLEIETLNDYFIKVFLTTVGEKDKQVEFETNLTVKYKPIKEVKRKDKAMDEVLIRLNKIVDNIEKRAELAKGPKGDKGDSFKYEDFTKEQLEGLRGPKGLDGKDGKNFTFKDMTEDEKESLRGPKGYDGKDFTYSDFTREQLAKLRGPQGEKGQDGKDGKPFTYDDFTPSQLANLKGEKGQDGAPFTYDDFTKAQLEKLRGPKGIDGKDGKSPTVTVGEVTTRNAGENASVINVGTRDDLILNFSIPRGIQGPKGDKGEGFVFEDLTPEQIEKIRGPKGDKGDNLKLADLSPEELAKITGPKGDEGKRGPMGLTGPQGAKGADGKAAKVSIGSVITGRPGTDATVVNTGSDSEAILSFSIPRGFMGEKGDAGKDFKYEDFTEEQLAGLKGVKGDAGKNATVTIGKVYTGGAGTNAEVKNTGKENDAVLDFVIPQGVKGDKGDEGKAATISIGSVKTVEAEENATVTNAGTIGDAILNFNIPKGKDGVTPTINIGRTTTKEAGTSATVINTGTATDVVLNFAIPRGDKGEQGEQGIQGPTGPQGPRGYSGSNYVITQSDYDSIANTVLSKMVNVTREAR